MKFNRSHLYILLSSLALLTVLVIQVSWIIRTARIKEAIFSEKANMVLSKTTEAIASDSAAHRRIASSATGNEIRKIDSLFNYYMRYYEIDIGYFFEVAPGSPLSVKGSTTSGGVFPQTASYQACMPAAPNQDQPVELRLVFPDKEQFIMAEMGIPFIASVTLILAVLFLSWRTMISLLNEKRISEHTTEFLNNMTHEFKTPLTNIALAGRMILKDTNIRQEDKVRHYSGIILGENEKLRLQVEQVLSMTALERGEMSLQKKPTDVHALIGNAVNAMRIQAEHLNGSIRIEKSAVQHTVAADGSHLTNALCNLLDNAIKYSGGPPDICISTSNAGKQIVISVSDKGIGIPEKYHDKIFDKFFRVPTGDLHDVKGFGLGLAYTKKIVELHGGTIAVGNGGDEGTEFIITLPLD